MNTIKDRPLITKSLVSDGRLGIIQVPFESSAFLTYLYRSRRSPRSEAPSQHNQSCSCTSALQQRTLWISGSAYESSPSRWGTQPSLPQLCRHTQTQTKYCLSNQIHQMLLCVRQTSVHLCLWPQDNSPPAMEPRVNLQADSATWSHTGLELSPWA